MTMRIGLIGGGNISATHAHAASAIDDVEVVAVFGSNLAKVREIAREHSAVAYTDLTKFLRHKPMDMVAIGSPSGMHAEQGIMAAVHGLHVLAEKPIDISSERTDELIAACEQNGVKLGVFFQDRFKPDIAKMKRWIDEGHLGRLQFVDARVRWYRPPEYYANSRWRGTWLLDGGGALMNQGIHTVDLLLWMAGDLKNVRAITRTLAHEIETEDTAVALLEFKNGAIGTLQASTAIYPGYPRTIELTGEGGTVKIEHDTIAKADLRNITLRAVSRQPEDQQESASSPVVSDYRAHKAMFEDFIAAIRENRAPACDGREGRRSVAVVEAIYRSAKSSGKLIEC